MRKGEKKNKRGAYHRSANDDTQKKEEEEAMASKERICKATEASDRARILSLGASLLDMQNEWKIADPDPTYDKPTDADAYKTLFSPDAVFFAAENNRLRDKPGRGSTWELLQTSEFVKDMHLGIEAALACKNVCLSSRPSIALTSSPVRVTLLCESMRTDGKPFPLPAYFAGNWLMSVITTIVFVRGIDEAAKSAIQECKCKHAVSNKVTLYAKKYDVILNVLPAPAPPTPAPATPKAASKPSIVSTPLQAIRRTDPALSLPITKPVAAAAATVPAPPIAISASVAAPLAPVPKPMPVAAPKPTAAPPTSLPTLAAPDIGDVVNMALFSREAVAQLVAAGVLSTAEAAQHLKNYARDHNEDADNHAAFRP